MDEGRYKAAGLGYNLTHQHLVANLDHGLCRGADVLRQGYVHCRRDGELLNGAVPGNLAVVGVYTANGECMLTHLACPPLLLPGAP